MKWHPDEGIEDDSSMTEQGLGFAAEGIISMIKLPVLFLIYLLMGVPKHRI